MRGRAISSRRVDRASAIRRSDVIARPGRANPCPGTRTMDGRRAPPIGRNSLFRRKNSLRRRINSLFQFAATFPPKSPLSPVFRTKKQGSQGRRRRRIAVYSLFSANSAIGLRAAFLPARRSPPRGVLASSLPAYPRRPHLVSAPLIRPSGCARALFGRLRFVASLTSTAVPPPGILYYVCPDSATDCERLRAGRDPASCATKRHGQARQ